MEKGKNCGTRLPQFFHGISTLYSHFKHIVEHISFFPVTDRNSKDAANSYQGRQRSQGPATASTLYMRSNEVDQNVIIVCVFCKQQHFSASCETVKDINQRKNILLRDRRCFTCLKTGHLSKNCRSTRKCRKCSGNHHHQYVIRIIKM